MDPTHVHVYAPANRACLCGSAWLGIGMVIGRDIASGARICSEELLSVRL